MLGDNLFLLISLLYYLTQKHSCSAGNLTTTKENFNLNGRRGCYRLVAKSIGSDARLDR